MNRAVRIEEIAAARQAAIDLALGGAGFLYARQLANGRVIYLAPFCKSDGSRELGRVRLGIARDGHVHCYLEYWDYEFGWSDLPWRAAIGWDGQGEPLEGWVAHEKSLAS